MRTLEKSRIHGRSTTLSLVSRSHFSVSPLAQKPAYLPAISNRRYAEASSDLMILANETRNLHLDVELKARKEDTDKKGHSFKNQLRSVTEGINNIVEKVGQLGRPRLGFLSKTPLLPARGEDAFASSNGRSRRTLSLTDSNHWRLSDVTSTARGPWSEPARKKRMKIRKLKAKGMRNWRINETPASPSFSILAQIHLSFRSCGLGCGEKVH